MMIRTEVIDESKCCCSCEHNKRTDQDGYIVCHCDKDGHYIGYVANFTQLCDEWNEDKDVLEDVEHSDVVQVQTLKAEIYKLKCQQDSKNQDYYTGYMSALSTVDGILAEMDGEE